MKIRTHATGAQKAGGFWIPGLTALLVSIVTFAPERALGQASIRPIEDFVDAQGTFCIDDGAGGCFLFVPPVANFVGFSDFADCRVASVDYAGLANAYIEDVSGGTLSLGTSTSGTILETPLPDGRALVRVNLLTSNALSWAVEGDPADPASCFDFNASTAFGVRAPEVLAGAAPALGDSFMQLTMVNSAPGAPLPDLIQLLVAPEPGQELRSIMFQASAEGTLQDGMAARLHVVQVGLFTTGFRGAVADGFPAEEIEIIPVRQ